MSSISVDCTVEVSTLSDNETSVSCSDPDYTLVSCGIRTLDPQEEYYIGSWIEGQTCVAKNWPSTDGVYAIARCCNLSPHSFSCNTVESPQSPTDDDSQTSATCAIDETLMGCTVRGYDTPNDGCYPSYTTLHWFDVPSIIENPTTCKGQNGFGDGVVRSYATCCTSNEIVMDCEAVWSQDLDSAVNHTMSCPRTDQFMTSCNGITSYRFINGWEINTNNECEISKALKVPKNNEVYQMVATCCSISSIDSLNPTANPTTAPTKTTSHPTLPPTKSTPDVTRPPTKAPTTVTSNPTTATPNPTTSTSNSNTATLNPTKSTLNPTKAPTAVAIKNPARSAQLSTANPSRSPIVYTTESSDNVSINRSGDIIIIVIVCCIISVVLLIYLLYLVAEKRKKTDEQHIMDVIDENDEAPDVMTQTNDDERLETNNRNINTVEIESVTSPITPNAPKQYQECNECGAKSKKHMDSEGETFVCDLCKSLNNDDMNDEVNKMFEKVETGLTDNIGEPPNGDTIK